MKSYLEELRNVAERELSSSSHDMDHVMRVYNSCLEIAEDQEGVDLDVLKAAVLLHDIARVKEDEDPTGETDHAVLGAREAGEILRDIGFPEEKIGAVKHCILAHRFRSENEPKSKEAKILFDGDKLDVLGAVGVARSFMIAGEYGERLYASVSMDEYVEENLVGGETDGRIKDKRRHAPNIEFETKFKQVPDRLYTREAKEMARDRLRFMKEFFDRLGREIEGEL